VRKVRRKALFLIALFLPLIVLGSNTYPVMAETDVVTEDFTSTTYKDMTNTNATKWDSGLVELPRDIRNMTREYLGIGFDYIVASGNFAYMVSTTSHIWSMNISNPHNVTFSDWWAGNGYPYDLWISGDYGYVACGINSQTHIGLMQVVNITDPYELETVGNGSTGVSYGYLNDICGEGDYAYVSSPDYVYTFDVSDPKSPSLVDTISAGAVNDIACSDGFLYVLDGTDINVYDLSTPSNPTYHGFKNLGVTCKNVFIEDDYAFAGYANGLKIISISNPASPAVVATYGTSDEVLGIFTDGNYTYLASDFARLIVLNVTNHSDPLHHYTFDLTDCDSVYIQDDYAYVLYRDVTYNGYLGVWDISGINYYAENAQAQSSIVYTSSSDSTITGAVLKVNQSIPASASISYSLSADDGLHWIPAIPGQYHEFEYYGKHLKWRAQLSTTDNTTTPAIYSLNITCYMQLNPVTLSSPKDEIHTSDDTPTFTWSSLSEADEYILQIDTSHTFDSGNFRNITTVETEYTPTTPLSDSIWYWQVFCVDSENQRGLVSLTESLVVDTTGPEWDEEPTNLIRELGMPIIYDLNASDISGIDHWWTNDTSHFEISVDGVITNKTRLGVGTYGLEIRVYDTLDNYCNESISLKIQDTISPHWIVAPSNQVLNFGDSFDLELQVTDASGIWTWDISDTEHFGISDHWNALDRISTAMIYNQTILEPGTYALTITVTDNNENELVQQITITVNNPTSPTDTIVVDPFPYSTLMLIGGIGAVVLIGGYVILKRR